MKTKYENNGKQLYNLIKDEFLSLKPYQRDTILYTSLNNELFFFFKKYGDAVDWDNSDKNLIELYSELRYQSSKDI